MSSNETTETASLSSSRVILDYPTAPPSSSTHWENLKHRSGDRLLRNKQDLVDFFCADIASGDGSVGAGKVAFDRKLARWSCICGYIESLTTHKDAYKRYAVFPIPIDAVLRLVDDEFLPFLNELELSVENVNHREAVKRIANAVWAKVISKPSVRDEIHANSLYVFLRGSIDRRTLDCFGSAVVTIAGLLITGYTSYLTLSEDHAYESHPSTKYEDSATFGTCEIAVPGNTKLARNKRGREIVETFSSNPHRTSHITPQTSWLYMAAHPVLCTCVPMAISAVIGNINCRIETQQGKSVSSAPLYEIKRDLLWTLYDEGYLDEFPFAVAELGECEENMGSERGLEWVTVEDIGGMEVLRNEKLFLDAISVSRKIYEDSQVYPYCYAGHYHKDAGKESDSQEYRLAEALRLYSHAARVASRYPFEPGDSMQLVKTMSKLSELIYSDVLTLPNRNSHNCKKREPRRWSCIDNAVSAASWLLAFYDYLLLWEERSGGGEDGASSSSAGKHFVEVLSPSHKHGIARMFQILGKDVRDKMVSITYDSGASINLATESDKSLEALTHAKLQYYTSPKSKRLISRVTPLVIALSKEKICIGEIELTIPGSGDGRRRRTKRARP